MKVKFFNIRLDRNGRYYDDVEGSINGWLADLPDEEFIHQTILSDSTILFLYGPPSLIRNIASASSTGAMCGQCKKQPPAPGKKSCADCQEYQRKYREKQREDRVKNRYP